MTASLALIPGGLPKAAAQVPGLVISGILRQNPDLEAGQTFSSARRSEERTAATVDTVYCRSYARLKTGRAAWNEGSSACTLVLTVDSIWVTVEKSIGIRLPSGEDLDGPEREHAKEILSAHEESHSLLHRQLFFQTVGSVVKEIFKSFPQRITVIQKSCPMTGEPAVENRWDASFSAAARVLERILDDFNGKTAEQISKIDREAGEAYDFATNHGRRGSDGDWPSVENQFQAAREAIQNFKFQARY